MVKNELKDHIKEEINPSWNQGQRTMIIENLSILAHSHIDWSVNGGMIWLVSGLLIVGISMAIVAIADFLS